MRLADGSIVVHIHIQSVDEKPHEVTLTANASATEDQFQAALVTILKDWRLFGKKLA